MRARGTHACTIAETRKPRTSAHQTSHAISTAFHRPSPIVSSTPAEYPLGVSRCRLASRCTGTVDLLSRLRPHLPALLGAGLGAAVLAWLGLVGIGWNDYAWE